MYMYVALIQVNLRAIYRDRVLHAILGAMLVLLLLVPSISSFSMRQVQELAVSLSLSGISFFLLVMALMLGSSSIWKDVEQRYTISVLTLPVSRTAYVLAKFAAVSIFLIIAGCLLGLCAIPLISISAASFPSEQPILWSNFILALSGDITKSILVGAIAILLSTISTSFYLPFFSTLVVFMCGSASQEVYEYVTGEFGREISPFATTIIKGVYYVLPNLSAFNYKIQAVYALPVPLMQISWSILYGFIYIVIVLSMAVYAFNRRVLG